jgi:redox-sensing transcriptional repressor
VRRLSLYLRQAEHLAEQGVDKVSSAQLADSLKVSPAQVRKDLAYFGQFGQPGVGYRVRPLRDELRRILGTDKTWDVVVVGAGSLCRALLRYKGFLRRGFRFVAAFDAAPGKVGKRIGDVTVHRMSELASIVKKHRVKLAILAVPAAAAQEVTDQLCEAGIKGILNFAPATLATPADVAVGPVDLAAHLEQMSFLVGNRSAASG